MVRFSKHFYLIATLFVSVVSISAGITVDLTEGLQEVAQTLKDGSVNFGANIGLHKATQGTLVAVGKSLENTGQYLQTTAWEFGKNMSIDPATFISLQKVIQTAGATAGGAALMTGGIYLTVNGIKDVFSIPATPTTKPSSVNQSRITNFLATNYTGLCKCTAGLGMFAGGLLMTLKCHTWF